MKPLSELTDAELSECFAVEVAGWSFVTFPNGHCPNIKHWKKPDGSWASIYMDGKFSTSADAVLPWLEKMSWCATNIENEVRITITKEREMITVYDSTFARAACIALIEAKRRESQ